jgi:hypothetical protein
MEREPSQFQPLNSIQRELRVYRKTGKNRLILPFRCSYQPMTSRKGVFVELYFLSGKQLTEFSAVLTK